jgi:hypothetical protein
MWLPYRDTTILHGNLAISYLRSLMLWYGKRGWVLMDVAVLHYHVATSTLFFIKYLSL